MTQARAAMSVLLLAAAAIRPAVAQDDTDWDLLEQEAAGEAAAWDWEWYSETRLRSDTVRDLPSGHEFERLRLHALVGVRWFSDSWEVGTAFKIAAGTDDNEDNVANLDNEESNEVDLGDFYIRAFPTDRAIIEMGKTSLPLDLSPMVWDRDLRPTGISVQQDWEPRPFDRLIFLAGRFRGLHYDESRTDLTAAQIKWRLREGAPRGGSVALTVLDFSDLDVLAQTGRGRTNRLTADPTTSQLRYLNQYRILDLELGYQTDTPWGVLLTQVNLARNLEADQDDEAARLSIELFDPDRQGWDFGYALQRVQREAVVSALNDDDWWFGTGMRGYRLSAGYWFNPDLRLGLSAFVERFDPASQRNKRLLLDLTLTR
ncbi:MAG: hypothetical protein QNJ40_19170 [Xanthomonadales bacterium]|nr:hypothetical protein [Xanthomonadales bacterium]